MPKGGPAGSLAEAEQLAAGMRYPLLVRASFALGGSGASWVNHPQELPEAVQRALLESSIHQAWLEESIVGWKEYELEVMRDAAGNFVVVCTIENFDPMGVHTGDSITVAPAQTLTDREYQRPARPGPPGDGCGGRGHRRLERAVCRQSRTPARRW